MSTAVIPPPNSTSVMRHVPRLTSQARALLTAVNLHFAGVAALLVLNLYLGFHLLYLVQSLHANNAEALQQQRSLERAAEVAALPLRGLDVKLVNSTADADAFYRSRLPYAYSQVLSELGRLTKAQNVRLTGVQYSQAPVLSGDAALREVKMDARVAGDYRPLVQLVNALERDKMFFVINTITFTGTNSGQVTLRMRMTTYLRQPSTTEPIDTDPTEGASGDFVAPAQTPATPQLQPVPMRRPGGAR